MPDRETLEQQASALRAQLADVTQQLQEVQAEARQVALARLQEIRDRVRDLISEAEECANTAGLPFYSDTFIRGIEHGSTYAGEPYWTQSDYC